MTPRRVVASDIAELLGFLGDVDLTLSGLDSPHVRLWVTRDPLGRIRGCTGYESSGTDVLIRSVAVEPESRGKGLGLRLAQFALDRAAENGAERAWLFSRRSGPFWQKLGFERAETDALAHALASTHQVRLFIQTGQLEREVAWTRALP